MAAGTEKQARKVCAKESRNTKVSKYRRSVVELKEGLHVLLQDQKTKLFNIEAVVSRVCEGGRSAYVQGKDRGGKVATFLRNRRFMIRNPRHNVEMVTEAESAMATREARLSGDSCLPVKQLSRKARAAFWRTKACAGGFVKSTLARLSAPPRSPIAKAPMGRRTVTWGPVTFQ